MQHDRQLTAKVSTDLFERIAAFAKKRGFNISRATREVLEVGLSGGASAEHFEQLNENLLAVAELVQRLHAELSVLQSENQQLSSYIAGNLPGIRREDVPKHIRRVVQHAQELVERHEFSGLAENPHS